MVGARFRWNEAKSRRRLLLIRAWGGERFGAAGTASGGRRGCGGACGVRVRVEPGGATAVVDAAARWRHGALRCRWSPSCALALRGSGGAGFHVRLTPQCRGAVGCGSVCGVAAAGTANAVGGALPCGRRRGCGRLVLFGGAGVAGAREVWRWSAAQGLRALGRFVDAGWQDLRAVHDSRGPCSERRPFLARSSRGVFPNSCLQGFSDAWRAYLAKASSFRMRGARILPRTGDFPVRSPLGDA